ncbi:hypothetical protein L6164_009167 [Bauhinia variegata]|uniref:Uncharacterized protein n=1 Tax=Bauhinia variegata TaxID=167791 RepID=A0ACB9PKH1_BAUVA|nr:hypothetical protein L6164_009167 [Bauhinia variegata]
MIVACNSLFVPSHFIAISNATPARNITPSRTYFPSAGNIQHKHSKREFPLPSVASVPYQPINVDYLEEEFSGHGVTFEEVGDSCVAKMELANGSVATLLLPSGLITSYKALMWHGGKVELLHTAVSEGDNGGAIIQGGVSLDFNFRIDDGEVSWSPNNWILNSIKGDPEESIQVELITRASESMLDLKYVVTLQEDILSSELQVLNSKSLPLQMTGSILTHLTVSTPDATFALGLERSNYFTKPPLVSEFFLSPPDSGQEEGFGKMLKQLFPIRGKRNQSNNQVSQMDGEEMDSCKHLGEQMSLIYTNAPRNFTVIDRGRRNSVVVGREGFDEMYLFSPGSSSESYSKYAYICIGQAAILKPAVLSPQEVWRGVQHIHNPNL